LTTLCRGCKALIIPADDEYNLYSLQRAIYPVDPLMTLPQPTSWVTLTCEDGYVVKKLYSQNDDWVVFWQQMLAECENHKNAEPESPTVITPPGEDVEDDQTPDLPPKPDPKPDPMPGPDTVVEPPVPAPPTPEPTPVNQGGVGDFNWPPGINPPFPATPPGTPGHDPELPANTPGKQWAVQTTLGYTAFAGESDEDLTVYIPFAFAMVISFMRKLYQDQPGNKYFFYWREPTWEWVYFGTTSAQHGAALDRANFIADGSPTPDIINYYNILNHTVMGSYWYANIEFKFIYEIDL
jgi:hypothetical protein